MRPKFSLIDCIFILNIHVAESLSSSHRLPLEAGGEIVADESIEVARRDAGSGAEAENDAANDAGVNIKGKENKCKNKYRGGT